MTNLRISCQVLRQVEHLRGLATINNLDPLLPELERPQILRALESLVAQDRVMKNKQSTEPVAGPGGGTRAVKMWSYRVNQDWEPGKSPKTSDPRPPKSRSKRRSAKPLPTQAHAVVNLRARKVDCLLRVLDETHGTDRDLMIGILADYGHKVSTRAS
ncbi:MAG: hypothetical protein ACR2Q3_01640 [Woeseiaceae bacterium]